MDFNSNFFSALAGAIVGGLASFLATWWQHCLENKRKEGDSTKVINAAPLQKRILVYNLV